MYDQSKAKREFLSLINASVSDELRNPLNSIVA
jgi:signal transduction histidine kinase